MYQKKKKKVENKEMPLVEKWKKEEKKETLAAAYCQIHHQRNI